MKILLVVKTSNHIQCLFCSKIVEIPEMFIFPAQDNKKEPVELVQYKGIASRIEDFSESVALYSWNKSR